MSADNLKEFSAELKKIREEKGITLQQIYNKTRIDVKYLQAIEENNFSIMPDVYMKAFLKEYTQTLNLDPDEIIEKYLFAKTGRHTTVEKPDSKENVEIADEDLIPDSKLKKSNFPFDDNSKIGSDQLFKIIAIVLVSIIVFSIYFIFFYENEVKIVKETPYEEILEENNKRYEQVTPTIEQNTPVQAKADSLQLMISAVDTVWMKIISDELVTSEFIMYPGRKKELKANEKFIINLGNAGGAVFNLDGNDLDFQGQKGRVRSIQIDKSGWKYISTQGTNTENDN